MAKSVRPVQPAEVDSATPISVIPGESWANVMKLRPLSGRATMLRSVITCPTTTSSGFTNAAAAVTSTDVETSPNVILMSTVSLVPTRKMLSGETNRRNPRAVAVTSYVAGAMRAKI